MSLLVAIAIADLCGEVPASGAPDAADSAAYTTVGDDARATDARVAAIAYRKALGLDPSNAAARAALAELCRSAAHADDALLPAIARFRRGDLDGAEALLAPFAVGNGPDAAGAHFFLGLIALARHDGAARDELAAARRDPAYAGLADSMLRIARRQGLVEIVALIAPELDSNPQLLPDTPPAGATTGPAQEDEDLLLAGVATVRPLRGLVVRDALTWRAQRTLRALDYLGNEAQIELARPIGGDRVAIRYDLDYDRLDGASYLVAHRATIAYRHELGGLALVADYALRRRDYLQVAEDAFTGWVHTGEAGVSLHAGPAIELDIRATAWRERTADPAFSELAAGAIVAIHARPRDGLRLVGTATAWYARYDGAEPDGELRRDLHGEFAADAELDLSDHVIAVAGFGVAGNRSTIDDFHYWRLGARCGLAIALGGP